MVYAILTHNRVIRGASRDQDTPVGANELVVEWIAPHDLRLDGFYWVMQLDGRTRHATQQEVAEARIDPDLEEARRRALLQAFQDKRATAIADVNVPRSVRDLLQAWANLE